MRVPPDFIHTRADIESTVEQTVVAWAMNNGWQCRKLRYIGKNGCPDHAFIGYGRWLVIEFKKPGGRLSKDQVGEHEALKRAGFEVPVYNNADSAIAFLCSYM